MTKKVIRLKETQKKEKVGKMKIIQNQKNPNQIFSKFVTSNKDVLCLYHWNACGYCREFVPIWNNVINQMKDKINVVSIELEGIRGLESKYSVASFPTILIYRNGERYKEFNKRRNEKELMNFINSHLISNN